MKTKYPTNQSQQDLKRVAECLYRSQNSNIYYAILKRGGKKIQRSLKIPDGAMAKRRLKDLTEQSASLAKGGDTKAAFSDVAERWLKMATMTMKPSSAERQTGVMQSLSKFFGPLQIRKLTKTMVEDWAAERSKEIAGRTYNYTGTGPGN